MKKIMLILSLLLVLVLSISFSYANEQDTRPGLNVEVREDWHQEKIDWKRKRIDEALDDGIINEDQARTWNEHFDYMEDFHDENGFMPGGCHGYRKGMRRGMMRTHGWNR